MPYPLVMFPKSLSSQFSTTNPAKSQEIDKITYVARLTFRINPDIELPSDTSARIVAKSLLGGYVLELSPGSNAEIMEQGDIIYDTIDPVSLTDLLGKFVFQNSNQ